MKSANIGGPPLPANMSSQTLIPAVPFTIAAVGGNTMPSDVVVTVAVLRNNSGTLVTVLDNIKPRDTLKPAQIRYPTSLMEESLFVFFVRHRVLIALFA